MAGTDRPNVPQIFDRRLLRARQRRAALAEPRADFLLRHVADDFAERLAVVRRPFRRVACFGPVPEILAQAVRSLDGVEDVVAVANRAGAIGTGSALFIAADEEALPFADESLDLVLSGLSLQLVNDLPGALLQLRRSLRPDGLMLAALLGGESLRELRQAWLVAEDEVTGGASPRVAPFADVRDLGALLQRAGFALPVADSEMLKVRYASALHLMRDVKAMGASNMLVERRRVPVSRRLLIRATEIYAERYAEADGRIAATFEIITLTGWAPHESQQKPLAPGSATTRLADALGVTEHALPRKPKE